MVSACFDCTRVIFVFGREKENNRFRTRTKPVALIGRGRCSTRVRGLRLKKAIRTGSMGRRGDSYEYRRQSISEGAVSLMVGGGGDQRYRMSDSTANCVEKIRFFEPSFTPGTIAVENYYLPRDHSWFFGKNRALGLFARLQTDSQTGRNHVR